MPELPEVEVTRRGIAGPLAGARIERVRLGKPLRFGLGRDTGAFVGEVVGGAQRRGKYLWLPLERGGSAAGGLLVHLGMSGKLALLADPIEPGVHDHFDLVTDRGTLRLNDPRRFGSVVWSASLDAAPAAERLQRLGAEPFDDALTAASFHAALQRRSTPIKALLLQGGVVVGAGNIYASEALHRAGIHPATRADRIGPRRAARLLQALRDVLTDAIDLGGSTLRDFADAHGVNGRFQGVAAVYGREGQPCRRCGAALKRVVQAQRASYFCAACQKR